MKPRDFTPIPNYWRFCGWCGMRRLFGHTRTMTVCGTCGH